MPQLQCVFLIQPLKSPVSLLQLYCSPRANSASVWEGQISGGDDHKSHPGNWLLQIRITEAKQESHEPLTNHFQVTDYLFIGKECLERCLSFANLYNEFQCSIIFLKQYSSFNKYLLAFLLCFEWHLQITVVVCQPQAQLGSPEIQERGQS